MFTRITYLDDAISLVQAKGRLDIYSSSDYLEEIKESLKLRYAKELILDFSGITFVASIGLRAILELHKIMQGKSCILKFKNVSKEVLNTFEMTGFTKFLIIENDSDNQEENKSSDQYENIEGQVESKKIEDIVSNIVKNELGDIINGLRRGHYQIATIMGCDSFDGNLESAIVQMLLADNLSFNNRINICEKISKNEYINEWTNQHIPFNKEIQKFLVNMIPKLKEIRTKINNIG